MALTHSNIDGNRVPTTLISSSSAYANESSLRLCPISCDQYRDVYRVSDAAHSIDVRRGTFDDGPYRVTAFIITRCQRFHVEQKRYSIAMTVWCEGSAPRPLQAIWPTPNKPVQPNSNSDIEASHFGTRIGKVSMTFD